MKTPQRIAALCLRLAFAKTLLAYLDPGSGSLIAQLLLAAIIGILATFRLWKNRLLRLFGIKPKPDDDAINDDRDDPDNDPRDLA